MIHKLFQTCCCLFVISMPFLLPSNVVWATEGVVNIDLSGGGQIIGTAVLAGKVTDSTNASYYLDPAADPSLVVFGSVGIGTTTPLSKLSVNGGLHIGGDSDAGDNNILIDGTTTSTGTLVLSNNTITCTGCVETTDILTDTILAGDIAVGAIGTSEIADNTVATADILLDTIAAVDIAAGAVGTSEIADGTVGAADIGADAITASEIATSAVATAEILDSTILTGDIALDTILAADIAAGAVGTSEIADGTVVAADIAADIIGDSELMNGGTWNLTSTLTLSGGELTTYRTTTSAWNNVQGASDGSSYSGLRFWGYGLTANYGWYQAFRTTNNFDFSYYGAAGWKTALTLSSAGSHSDVAEKIASSEPTEKGDLLSIDNFTNVSTVIITTIPYDKNLIGVVSTKPGLAINGDDTGLVIGAPEHDPMKPLISLAGRVPVKIFTTGEKIALGGEITSSPLKGYGMSATKVGKIVGKALETFTPTKNCTPVSSIKNIVWPDDQGENELKPCFKVPVSSFDPETQNYLSINHQLKSTDDIYVGKIMIYIGSSWYDPDTSLTSTSDFKVVGENNNYSLKDKNDSIVARIGTFAELVAAKIQAGLIETKKLLVDGVDILKKLNELSVKVESQQKQIEELSGQIKELQKK